MGRKNRDKKKLLTTFPSELCTAKWPKSVLYTWTLI